MRPPNPFEVCTDDLLPDVQEYGGKFGPLENLRRRPEFQSHLLPTEYVMPGEFFQGDSSFDRPYVRASHPIDIRDMVGVLETLPAESRSNAHVNAIVDQIRRQATSRDVIGFANYTATPTMYNPDDVVLGVQPYVSGMRASILRHPNRAAGDDEFVISWFRNAPRRSTDRLASGLEINSSTVDIAGRIRHQLGDTLSIPLQKNMSPEQLIDLYLRVERTGLMRDDRVFLMEAVGDENDLSRAPYVCQLRDFKQMEHADWRIDASKYSLETPKLVFGVTPEQGIRLTVQQSPDCLDKDGRPLPSLDKPWALLKTIHKGEPPLKFQPEGMEAYFAGFRFGSGMASLAHMQERLAAIANVTVFEDRQKPFRDPLSRGTDSQYYNPRTDMDFSRRMVAAMAKDEDFPGRTLEFADGNKLSVVRGMTGLAAQDTNHQDDVLELLESVRGSTFDVILKSDGYTATIREAATRAPVIRSVEEELVS